MVKQKTLYVLVIIALVSIAAVIAVLPKTTTTSSETKYFLPTLANRINDVAEIAVTSKDSSFAIKNENGKWVLPQQGNYPVATSRVQEMLVGMSELIRLEAKTTNPDNFNLLDLEDLSLPESKAVQITLKDKQGQQIFSLYVGKTRPARGNSTLQEFFVRHAQDRASFEVVGVLPNFRDDLAWLDNKILLVRENEIKRVELSRSGVKELVLSKSSPSESIFTVGMLTNGQGRKDIGSGKNGKVTASPYAINYIAATLGGLTFDKAYTVKDVPLAAPAKQTAVLETFGGMVINYELYSYKNQPIVKLHAVVNDVADSGLDAEQRQKQAAMVADLNAKFAEWVYVIPDFQAAEFNKTTDALMAPQT